MNIAVTPAQRREIIAAARKLCEGEPGNLAESYYEVSRLPVYDAPDGRMAVLLNRGRFVAELRLDLAIRQETVRNGRQAVRRFRSGVYLGTGTPPSSSKPVEDALDLLLEQAQELWADFPEEAVIYGDRPE